MMPKKKFGFVDYTKEGKGLRKEDYVEEKPFTLSTFFKTFGRNFWNFTSLNFMYLLLNFPLFFGLYALSGNLNFDSPIPANEYYPQFFGMMKIKPNPVLQLHFARLGEQAEISVFTNATYIFFAITLLFIFTFGISNCGMTHLLRGYTRKDPVFPLTDFIDCIKTNWKQALPMGIIDIILSAVCVFVFNFWKNYPVSSFVNDIAFYLSLFALVVYFFMRFYMYTLLITFDLSIFKILKNSFIFALIGVKRNFVALLGIALVIFLNICAFFIFMPIGIILPFIITISLCSFIAVYCTYPVIKKIMIDPYYADAINDGDYNCDDDEPIFKDRG
jgi:uncharacterized membrane protein YesL